MSSSYLGADTTNWPTNIDGNIRAVGQNDGMALLEYRTDPPQLKFSVFTPDSDKDNR